MIWRSRRRGGSVFSIFRSFLLFLLGIVGLTALVAAWNGAIKGMPVQVEELTGQEFYREARPYLDEPLRELRREVPDLRGIDPADTQDRLPFLLSKVGDNLQEFFEKVPDLIADEEVIRTPHAGDFWRSTDQHAQLFNYLIMSRRREGKITLEEYRTDKQGGDLGSASTAPSAHGFALMWVPFYPGNRAESRFRYLGSQRVNGVETSVVAFAQKPGCVRTPGEVRIQGKPIPILSQGVVWIDESDFHILRLGTDLLAPRPEIQLETLTTDLRFGMVVIRGIQKGFWLPRRVTVRTGFKNEPIEETHSYSHYRLFNVRTRILTTPR